MAPVARIFHHAKKSQAISVRWLMKDTRPLADNVGNISSPSPLGTRAGDKNGIPKCFSGVSFSPMHSSINASTISAVGMNKGNALWTARNGCAPAFGTVYNSQSLNSDRRFSSNSGLPPHQEIRMPSLFPVMMEGNIVRWLKKEGDKVSLGEVLCEVEINKATVEMESMEEVYLAKILRGDGSNGIKVGEIIAITVKEEEDIAKFKNFTPSASGVASTPTPAPEEPSPPTPPKEEPAAEPVASSQSKASKPSAPSVAGDRIFASSTARKLAEDNNVSLSDVKGAGPNGRIVKANIEDYLAIRGKGVSQAPKVDATTSAGLDYVDIPHTQIKNVTVSRLLQSKQTIPHPQIKILATIDKLMELRNQLNSLQEASGGTRISVDDLVIKATALALRKVPQCNSSWTDDEICQYDNVNINFAVQTVDGLYVPVIRDADNKCLAKIADEVKFLVQKAKENGLKPDDYEGGTFTVAKLGFFGVEQFYSVVNPPHAGILAISFPTKVTIPVDGHDQYKFSWHMSITLSWDSRVIDCEDEWMHSFMGYIENPESLLV